MPAALPSEAVATTTWARAAFFSLASDWPSTVAGIAELRHRGGTMTDERPTPSSADEASGNPRAEHASRDAHAAPTSASPATAPRPSLIHRHPAGVAVGSGVVGLVLGAIATAIFMPLFFMLAPPP